MTDPSNDPGPVPGEKKTRRLNVNLPEEVEEKLRKVAEVTALPIYGLAEWVAASPGFAEACIEALRARYDAWWDERKDAADIFGKTTKGDADAGT
jgi:hypothetical protein